VTEPSSLAAASVDEDDLFPISALQHWLYCPRQCALIHVERLWVENRFTAEGRVMHARTDQPGTEIRRGVRTVTAMPIRSFRLGVFGVADVVEFHKNSDGAAPLPVDYKRGRPKAHRADEVQLCAQAMALEEMFAYSPIERGSIFYGDTRRRTEIVFDEELRGLTVDTAAAVRACFAAAVTPAPVYARRRCEACSLIELCRPRVCDQPRRASSWLAAALQVGD
jgi:CRISPR-associated exonuclease Cas4